MLLKVVPDRVRTVLPGMIILYTLVKHFHSDYVEVTRAGVRDGYLYRYVLRPNEPGSDAPATEITPAQADGALAAAAGTAEGQAGDI